MFLGFPCGSAGKESACNAGDLGSTPGLGRSRGEEKGYLLQYSGLENLAWVTKITWRRERLPAPVFWPGESGLGHKELDRTEPLSLSLWKQMQKVFFPITLSTLVSSYQNLREAILDKHSQNIITSRDYLKLLRVYLKALFFSFSLRDHVRLKLQRDQVAHLISKAQEKSQMLLES